MATTTASTFIDWTEALARQEARIRDQAELTRDAFNWRPATGKWSVGENIEHLSLTMGPYLGRINGAIDEGRRNGWTSPGPWKRKWLAHRFARSMEPPVRLGLPTASMLVPGSDLHPSDTVRGCLEHLDALGDSVERMRGLDLGRCTLRSPVLSLLKLDLGSAVDALLGHNRRHLWTIGELKKRDGFPG